MTSAERSQHTGRRAGPSGERGESFARVLEALAEAGCTLRQRGDHADAQCPAHDDRSPSLSVDHKTNMGKGVTVVYCHAGCSPEDVLTALGLRLTDTYDDPPVSQGGTGSRRKKHAQTQRPASTQSRTPAAPAQEKPLGAVEAEYIYAAADGTVVGWLKRHEGKQFRWWKPNATGQRRIPGAPKTKPLYLLPLVCQAITEGRTIHLCEGEKDADALVEVGEAATTVPGGATVTKHGSTKGNLTDAHIEALTGAHVVIWADRDGPDQKNPERGFLGYRHALHMRDALANVAASVRVVHTTSGKDAADHLAAGHTPTEAETIDPVMVLPASGRTDAAPGADDTPDNVYPFPAEHHGGGGGGGDSHGNKRELYLRERYERYEHPEHGTVLVQVEETSDTIKRTELLNADARLLRQVIRDIGEDAETEPLVDLEVTKDGQTHTLTSLPRKDFEDPVKWAGRIPLPLTFKRGHSKGKLVSAITQVSGAIPVDTAYGQLGWREIHPGQWAYLHANGAIGADGPLLGTRVEVSPRLRGFKLPAEIPTGDDLRASYDAVMGIADKLPHHIAYPLIAAGCRAVLGDCSTSLFALGPPGSYKSGTAALIQQMYFPDAEYDHMPAGAGEGAAGIGGLEQIMHEAGHTFLCLDDLAPDRGAGRSAARAAEILRAAGNRQGKLRLERDTSKGLRPDKLPRAMVVVSGEDQPTVQSAERRTVYLPFRRGDVSKADLIALSTSEQVTARSGLTAALAQKAAAMMPNKEWLRQQRAHWAQWLESSDNDGVNAGRCNNIAELATGIRTMLDLMVESGVLTREEAAGRWHEAWHALRKTLEIQSEVTGERKLTERFGELIRSVLVAHKAHLQDPIGGEPLNAEQFGWTLESSSSKTFGGKPGGSAIGWTDGKTIWLHPGAAFAAALAEGQAQSDPLAITQRALKNDLVESYPEYFAPPQKGKTQRSEPRVILSGVRQRVWALPYAWLYPTDEDTGNSTPPTPGPDNTPSNPDTTPSPAPEQPQPEPEPATPDLEPEDEHDATQPEENSSQKHAQTQQHARTQTQQQGKRDAEEPRYRAAGVVVDVDAAYFIDGSEQLSPPPVSTSAELMDWAVSLNLGVAHAGKRRTKDGRKTGARDDAGVIVVMPRLAKQLGAPAKPPRRDKPLARNHKTIKALAEAGWTIGERGLQPYTQIWRTGDGSKGGRAHFLVFPHWSTEPIYQDLPDAAQVAYRLSLYVGTLGHQLVYTAGSTGVGLVRQLRANTPKPLADDITEVPPPGAGKEHAPLEDLEWDYWRELTDDEYRDCTHIVGVDINASYLAAAQSAVLGHGAPEHVRQPTIGDRRTLRQQPGYWLLNPVDTPKPHPLAADLLDPHGTGRPREPVWVTTSILMALVEAGIQPTAREAWLYPNPGTHLQVWAHTLRNALYELKEYAHDADDPDAEAVLAEIKLSYAAGLGQLASQRWRKNSPLWLPHWNQTVKGLAQANIWRKTLATGQHSHIYPVGIARDAIYYAITAPEGELPTENAAMEALPVNVPSGFTYDGPDASYRIGRTKWAGTATLGDYRAAQAVTDNAARIEAMNAIWTTPKTNKMDRGE